MTHSAFQPGRTDCPGNLTVIYHLSRRSGVFTVYKCDACGWCNDPRRRRQQTEGAKPRIGATMKTMRLSLNRKAGAPNFGSDGAGMELEIELSDDTGMSGLPEIALTYYAMMEHTLQIQLERMSARHTGRAEDGGRKAEEILPPSSSFRPPPSTKTADDYDPEPARREPPPTTPRGNGRAPARSGGQDDRPRNGRQLIGWANNHGCYKELMALGGQYKDRGRIVDWDKDLVDWAYNDLSRPVGAGWGDGRN